MSYVVAVRLETLLKHLGIDWVVLHWPLGVQTTKGAADWTSLYNKDAEMVMVVNMCPIPATRRV